VPGAASFKRVLDGAHCPGARARRAPHGRPSWHALGRCFWAATGIGGAARRAPSVAALEWWGRSERMFPRAS